MESVGVRGNTHGRNEICAQTSSSRPNVNPIFPGITSGPRREEEVGESGELNSLSRVGCWWQRGADYTGGFNKRCYLVG